VLESSAGKPNFMKAEVLEGLGLAKHFFTATGEKITT